MAKVKFAVLGGAGVIGSAHCQGVVANSRVAELAGIFDVNAAGAAKRAEEFKTRVYPSEKALLDDPELEVVMLATPHPLHAEQAIRCLRAGKHVLSEKPIAVRVSEADRMLAEARKAKRLLGVCYQLRTSPYVIKARQLIERGAVGKVRHVVCTVQGIKHDFYYGTAPWRGTWRGEGGGYLINNAPHTLDMLVHLIGAPKRVRGITRKQLQDIETDDCAYAIFEYADGAVGSFATSCNVAACGSRLEIYGDRGTLRIQNGELSYFKPKMPVEAFVRRKTQSSLYAGLEVKEVPQTLPKAPGNHAGLVRNFVEAIRTGAPLVSPGDQAILSLEIVNAITLSSYTEAPVELPVPRAAYDRLLAKLISLGRKGAYRPFANPLRRGK